LTDARHGSHADKQDEEFDESAADHELDIESLDAAERHGDPIVEPMLGAMQQKVQPRRESQGVDHGDPRT
jgi:hypothetical protein